MLQRLASALYLMTATLWVGGLWSLGYIAAPVLSGLADRSVAGTLAGQMFSVIGWIGIGGGAYMLVFMLYRRRLAVLRELLFWCVLAMLLLACAQVFGLQPLIAQLRSESAVRELAEAATRNRFASWHGVASALYLGQSLLGLFVVLRVGKGSN